jgi:hypothetical protein
VASWQAAFATADGPDSYAVSGVAAEDTLSLRAGPSADAEKIGQIAHDARGLQNLGCQGLPSLTEWQEMTGAEREASRRNYWCRVRYLGVEGWVAGRFLREDGPDLAEDGPRSEASDFSRSCREIAAHQVRVSDEGAIETEETSVRETQRLRLHVQVQGGTESIRVVRIVEQVGQLRRELDGSMERGVAVRADEGHWLLDLDKDLLRRVEAVAGRSARFAIFTCEPS